MKHVTAKLSRGFLSATFVKDTPAVDITASFNLTYGLFILSAKDKKHNACIINTAFQVASNPFRIAISCQNHNYTREMIEKTGKFNLSVLDKSVPFDWIKRFGFNSGRDVDKFDGFTALKQSYNGLNYITEHVNAFFSAEVTDKIDLGSHTLFIGEVKEAKKFSDEESCTYAYYQKEIKVKG